MVLRQRYRAEPPACDACPLRAQCLQVEGTARTLSRDQYDDHCEVLRQRMATEKSSTGKSSTGKSSTQRTRRQTEGKRPMALTLAAR